MEKLNTGDIILCHCKHDGQYDPGIDGIIELFTHSPYEHAAMIIRDPPWIQESGLYILQSGRGPNSYPDVINGNTSGVTLNLFSDFIRNREYVCVRSITGIKWNKLEWFLLKKTFEKCHGRPYDLNYYSWICTGIGSYCYCPWWSNFFVRKQDNRFWCSALVAFIYTRMGWVREDLDWSDKTPSDLTRIKPIEPIGFSDIWRYN